MNCSSSNIYDLQPHLQVLFSQPFFKPHWKSYTCICASLEGYDYQSFYNQPRHRGTESNWDQMKNERSRHRRISRCYNIPSCGFMSILL